VLAILMVARFDIVIFKKHNNKFLQQKLTSRWCFKKLQKEIQEK